MAKQNKPAAAAAQESANGIIIFSGAAELETLAQQLGVSHLVRDEATNEIVSHDAKGREVRALFEQDGITISKPGLNAPYSEQFTNADEARQAFQFQLSDTQN